MKCRACMMGVPLAVALVALAWAVSVPVRGAKAMFAATNNACAYNGSAFSDPKGDGMQSLSFYLNDIYIFFRYLIHSICTVLHLFSVFAGFHSRVLPEHVR